MNLVPRQVVGTFWRLDVEDRCKRSEESEKLGGREISARAGAVAVAESEVTSEIWELAQGFLVCGPFGIEPAFRDELITFRELVWFAADEAIGALATRVVI